MTELLEKAVARVRALPPEQQDELAHAMLHLLGNDRSVYKLSDEEKASLAQSLEEMERGEFASDEEIEAIWAKYDL